MLIALVIGIAAWIAALALGGESRRALWTGAGLLTLGTLTINLAAPYGHLADSKYLLLAADTIIHDGHWHLDEFFPDYHEQRAANPAVFYQVYDDGEHLRWGYPPGAVYLSVPWVVAGRAIDVKVVGSGEYRVNDATEMQRVIAGILMAAMTLLIFLTVRMILPQRLAVLTALAGGLASPAWSELSRAVWIDTWGALLMAVTAFLLARWVMREKPLNPILLATVLSWAFFVKPTYAIAAALVFGFVAIRRWRLAIPMAITGVVWLVLYLLHNQWVFGTPLPIYLKSQSSMFTLAGVPERFAGLLISPSRGLLIYIPWLLMIPVAMIWGKRQESPRALAWLALVNVAVPLFLISGWQMWWGGHSFGPRLFAGTVPWMALLLAYALASLRERRWAVPVACVLIAIALFIHAKGVFGGDTRRWNTEPENIDDAPERLWDWSDPQFLR